MKIQILRDEIWDFVYLNNSSLHDLGLYSGENEVVDYIQRSEEGEVLSFKVDFEKAYDCVE
ncbi:hypothetical protein V6Z12_A11G376500 [Gossypium hirsutum]